MSEQLTITKEDLLAALVQWEKEHRAGLCMPREAAAKLTVEQVATCSTAGMWNFLQTHATLQAQVRPPKAMAAARDVLAERTRQIRAEGYELAHDDEHVNDELAALACFYAMPPATRDWPAEETGYGATFGSAIVPADWETRTGDRRRDLVKAGALILAEIERLDRAALRTLKEQP